MIIRVILLALALFVLLNIISYMKRQPPAQRKALLLKYSLYIIAALAILLAVTGRLHWIGAVIAASLPFIKTFGLLAMRHLPFQNWLKQQKFANPVMTTRFLRVVISVVSVQISGEVLAGQYKGATLESLSESQLQELLKNYQTEDPESARLISFYISKRFNQTNQQQSSSASSTQMSRREALQILGLDESADSKAVIKAHRSLMQKFHPDRGGSDYLAAKINQAKDFLLNT